MSLEISNMKLRKNLKYTFTDTFTYIYPIRNLENTCENCLLMELSWQKCKVPEKCYAYQLLQIFSCLLKHHMIAESPLTAVSNYCSGLLIARLVF